MSSIHDPIGYWASPKDIERAKKQRVLEAEVINAARDWHRRKGSEVASQNLAQWVGMLEAFWREAS